LSLQTIIARLNSVQHVLCQHFSLLVITFAFNDQFTSHEIRLISVAVHALIWKILNLQY